MPGYQKKGFAPKAGTAYMTKNIKTKAGKTLTAIQVVIEESSLEGLTFTNGQARLKGFLNVDQKDQNKAYAYLEVDTYVPKSVSKGAAMPKAAAIHAEGSDDDSSPF